MKNISNEFKTELTAFGRQYRNIINVYDNLILSTQSGDILLTENNNELIAKTSTTDVSMEINDENIYSIKLITKGEILSTLMKELDFESGLNLDIGSVIEYKFGLKVGNDYEYIDYGKYIIYKKEFNQDTKNYVYTCYDFMLKTMIMIGEEFHFITQPTGADMIPEICSILGIDFDDSTEIENVPTVYGMIKNLIYNINLSIINSSKITYRDLLNTLCQYFGVSMYMENNELKLKLLGNIIDDNGTWVVDNENVTIVDNVTKEFMKDKNVTFKNLYGPINSLIITGTDETKQLYVEDTPSVENNGLTTFKIEKNILINDTEVWDNYGAIITNNIFELLNNVNFELCDFSSNGIMYLDWLDYFNVTIDNNVYKCLLLNSEITVKSGISENIYTEIPEKNESEYTTSDKSNDIIGDTIRSRGNAYANGERLVQESEILDIYSTSEVKTNKRWIDGKPIYRKVIYGISPAISSEGTREAQVGSLTTNVELFTKIEGVAKYISTDNKYRQFPIPRAHYTNMNLQIGVYLTDSGDNTNDVRIEIGSNYYRYDLNIYIILEYTKTTI